MASTPTKGVGGAGARAHPTPSSSHRGREDARGAPRLRAMTPLAIAMDEFPFLEASWKKNPNLLTLSAPQDAVEHRFGHMRQGCGSHKNPTAERAKERAARGDLHRGLHGESRANYNRNARKGRDFVASGYRAEIMLPVGEEERSGRIRARTKDSAEAVLSPRYISVATPGAAPVAEGSAVERGAPQESVSRDSAPT